MDTPWRSIPSAGRRAASQALLVSVSSPMSNSVPMAKISAFTPILLCAGGHVSGRWAVMPLQWHAGQERVYTGAHRVSAQREVGAVELQHESRVHNGLVLQ